MRALLNLLKASSPQTGAALTLSITKRHSASDAIWRCRALSSISAFLFNEKYLWAFLFRGIAPRRCVRAAFWSTLSRGAIPLKRNAHKYFSLKRKAEMELNARQRQIASEALCRFVIERVKAEPVW